ncbi:carbamoyltransferase C-terminal domain-containing protein, partial [Streptomyces sp. 4N509B]|uniref:carbamoyltransferase C-terminal domain-containing protein n=1 Tax=Streptomyces sp. 4N509B TaxID=3457413 RepID=UPI003FD43626
PLLINTSFNVRGEPIVNTPHHAYQCFMRTHIDTLTLGPYILTKHTQPPWHETPTQWTHTIPPD